MLPLNPSKQHNSVPRPALQTPINPLTCSSAFSHTPTILYTAPTHILVQQFKPYLSPTHPPNPRQGSETACHTPINDHFIEEHTTQLPRIG